MSNDSRRMKTKPPFAICQEYLYLSRVASLHTLKMHHSSLLSPSFLFFLSHLFVGLSMDRPVTRPQDGQMSRGKKKTQTFVTLQFHKRPNVSSSNVQHISDNKLQPPHPLTPPPQTPATSCSSFVVCCSLASASFLN